MIRRLAFFVLIGASVALSACDSNDSGKDLGELAGEYRFDVYRFVPESPLLAPVNMLDTLVVTSTRLQLFSSGRFTLLYQFEGASPKFIGGDAERTSRGVRIKGDRADEALYADLLLPIELELENAAINQLSARLNRRVNLASFSDKYAGLPSVEGTLVMTLKRL